MTTHYEIKRYFKRKGQVSIFILVGIVVVAGIFILFYLLGGPRLVSPVQGTPDDFVKQCVRDSVEEVVEKIYVNGGEVEPSFSVKYLGEDYNYLCHTGDNYVKCYNIHPHLEQEIEQEIEEATRDSVQDCFGLLREDLDSRGFFVDEGPMIYSIDLLPGSIDINLERDISVTKGGSAQSYNNFNLRINDPLYELVKISKTIVTSESRFCAFERNGFMIFYPEYDIKMTNYDNNKIYSVKERVSEKEFKFAVRTCAVPAGF